MQAANSYRPNERRERWRASVAAKLYEICTKQGYVDDRDWREAARLARAEQRRNVMMAPPARAASPART